jgi:hypothetical protein
MMLTQKFGLHAVFFCRFIDYEYAGFNPVALDIANHWCEYAGNILQRYFGSPLGNNAANFYS